MSVSVSHRTFLNHSTGFKALFTGLGLLFLTGLEAPAEAQQTEPYVSQVWVADNGDGTYTNPILHADYSDPDVVRVGNDFYMTASSFNASPGLPILHSRDLVNWKLINHALPRLYPDEHFSKPRHEQGVWAPSIRYHKGHYYIFWGDPDFGIFMVKTDDPEGEWTEPKLVKGGNGLIDPSPLWDDDGRAYLVYAFARSRSGVNTVLVVQEMEPDASGVIGEAVLAFDGHDGHRVVEGPKFHKRGDTYYILAPAGGVTYGWQLAMRSDNVFGPYEEKVVLHQGSTDINGPHQGGLVELESGESWFVHFQDKYEYGRIVHLNPVQWVDGWPLMGVDKNGDGIGEPVSTYRKPDVGDTEWPIVTPPESDEFDSHKLGLQWQWHANPSLTWALTSRAGFLRIYGTPLPDDFTNFWDVPNLLLQKFPAPAFTATTKFTFTPHMYGEKAGLIVMGRDYSYLSLEKRRDGLYISQTVTKDADNGGIGEEISGEYVDGDTFWFRAEVRDGGLVRFSYSTDGQSFSHIGGTFQSRQGGWIGAKIGLFGAQPAEYDPDDIFEYSSRHLGFADYEWFRVTPAE
ncbi:glycoside hydrolase 43 family protein [Balneolales bacterium ANBcel1]|nr:glycoside hydrolase 43 family protein [Balneolales bacterium ANBcel1]